MRFRHEPLGDISRVSRQRKLLLAIYRKMIKPENVAKLPAIFKIAKEYTLSDLTNREIIQIVNLIRKDELQKNIFNYTIPGEFYEANWKPDQREVKALMRRITTPRDNTDREEG